MSGLFANAKKVETKATKAKVEKPTTPIAGVEKLAQIDFIMKSLKAMRDVVDAEVKEAATAIWVEKGCEKKAQPENLKGVEGDAHCSIELRKRSSASMVSDEEYEILRKNGIPTEIVVTTVETFVINPVYANNEKILKTMEKALASSIKTGALPEDLFQQQDGKEDRIVSANAMEVLFGKPQVIVEQLLPLVSTTATKPVLGTDDLAVVLEAVLNVTKAKPVAKKA